MKWLINRQIITQTSMLLILLFVFVGTNQAQKKIERNLKDYKVGETLEDTDSRWGNAEESGARDHINNYLWDLWEKKELAYFKVINYRLEGVSSIQTFYVEKGKGGNWQITVESDSSFSCPYKSKKKCEQRNTTRVYKDLKKVVDQNGRTKIKFVKDAKS